MIDYEKHARHYPVLFSTWPLWLAVPYLSVQGYVVGWETLKIFELIVLRIISPAVLTSIICWFLKDLFRWTSKLLVQRAFYGTDGMRFPTTTMLLHQTTDLSENYKKQIAQKVEKHFHLKFFSKSAEQRNPEEARRVIRDAVGGMREVTRHNELLLEYNAAYGAARNALGGCFWGGIALLAMWCYNSFAWGVGRFVVLELVLGMYWLLTLHARAKNYARALYDAFMNTPLG